MTKTGLTARLLLALLPTAAAPAPGLDQAAIKAAPLAHPGNSALPDQPVAIFQGVNMKNLWVVIETDEHHLTLLDGDKLTPLYRFASRYALQANPPFSPDGRYLYLASPDGWVSKFDIWNLAVVAETRVGLNTRHLTISSDGNYLVMASDQPRTLTLMDADLGVHKIMPALGQDGRVTSRVSAIHDAAVRKSFIMAFKDMAELWEISYDPQAPDIAAGLIHDYQNREGAFLPGFLNLRRTVLDQSVDDFWLTCAQDRLLGIKHQTGHGQVVQLDVRRKIADLNLHTVPHFPIQPCPRLDTISAIQNSRRSRKTEYRAP